MNRRKICAFFGHNQVEHNITKPLTAAIRRAVEEHGVTTFWCGNHGGFDRQAAGTAHRLKRDYPDLEIVFVRAYLPKKGEELEKLYDASIYPEGLELVPRRFAIAHKNKRMAKQCDMAITYVNYSFGGAYQAYHVLKNRHIHVINLGRLE